MFFFIVGNEIFYFFKKMTLCFFGRGCISKRGQPSSPKFWGELLKRGGGHLTDLEFSFLGWGKGGGSRGKTRWDRYFRIGLIPWRTLWWIFGKWFMKMPKKTLFISQQTYLSIWVRDILKFYEVFFCTYCKGLFCLQKTVVMLIFLCIIPTLGNQRE